MTRKSGLGKYHGSASDRGSADNYYRRPYAPHFWPEGSYKGAMVASLDMSPEEIDAYRQGWDENEDAQDFKDWGSEAQENDEPTEDDDNE